MEQLVQIGTGTGTPHTVVQVVFWPKISSFGAINESWNPSRTLCLPSHIPDPGLYEPQGNCKFKKDDSSKNMVTIDYKICLTKIK